MVNFAVKFNSIKFTSTAATIATQHQHHCTCQMQCQKIRLQRTYITMTIHLNGWKYASANCLKHIHTNSSCMKTFAEGNIDPVMLKHIFSDFACTYLEHGQEQFSFVYWMHTTGHATGWMHACMSWFLWSPSCQILIFMVVWGHFAK